MEVFKLVWVKAHKRLRFGRSLFGFLHDTTYLSQQFLLVLNYGAFPDKGVLFVTDSILVPVNELHIQRYEAFIMKQFHDSMKDVLEASDSKALAPEVVIVLKSGRIPLNHMKDTFPSNREAMRRPELMLVK